MKSIFSHPQQKAINGGSVQTWSQWPINVRAEASSCVVCSVCDVISSQCPGAWHEWSYYVPNTDEPTSSLLRLQWLQFPPAVCFLPLQLSTSSGALCPGFWVAQSDPTDSQNTSVCWFCCSHWDTSARMSFKNFLPNVICDCWDYKRAAQFQSR